MRTKDSVPSDRDTLATAYSAYAIAIAIFNIAPVLIGVLMDFQHLTESQAGLTTSADMICMAAVGFLFGPRLTRVSRISILLAGVLILLLGNVLSFSISRYLPLLLCRGFCGLGAGLLFVYANTRVASAPDPVRSFGLMTVFATLLGATLLFALPLAIGDLGQAALYGALGALALGFGVMAFREPRVPLIAIAAVKSLEVPRQRSSHRVAVALGLSLIALVQSAYFGFVERIGVAAGISESLVGGAIAAGYVGGIFTSAAATWLSTRHGRWRPLAAGIGLQALCIVAACVSRDSRIVIICIVAQSLALFFGIPYLLGLSAELDPSGRFANVAVGLFFFSLAAGPFLGGVVIERYGYAGIAALVMIGTGLGLVLLLAPARALAARR